MAAVRQGDGELVRLPGPLVVFEEGHKLAQNFGDVAAVDLVYDQDVLVLGVRRGAGADSAEDAGDDPVGDAARVVLGRDRPEALHEILVRVGLVEGRPLHEPVARRSGRSVAVESRQLRGQFLLDVLAPGLGEVPAPARLFLVEEVGSRAPGRVDRGALGVDVGLQRTPDVGPRVLHGRVSVPSPHEFVAE